MTKGSARSWQHKPAWKGAHGASKHPKFRRHPKQEALLSSAVGFAVIPHHSPTAFDGFAPALQVSESATTSKRLMRTVSRRCKSHVFESWADLPDVTRKIMATRCNKKGELHSCDRGRRRPNAHAMPNMHNACGKYSHMSSVDRKALGGWSRNHCHAGQLPDDFLCYHVGLMPAEA